MQYRSIKLKMQDKKIQFSIFSSTYAFLCLHFIAGSFRTMSIRLCDLSMTNSGFDVHT